VSADKPFLRQVDSYRSINAASESVMSTIKVELVRRQSFKTRDFFKVDLLSWRRPYQLRVYSYRGADHRTATPSSSSKPVTSTSVAPATVSVHRRGVPV
jgi:hypothetical protein